MATVYLARTKGVGGFERQVALKLVHAHLRADEESKLHLLEEAKLAALIRHPNVIQVLEIDDDPFGVFLVMDYVEGETLSGLVRLAQDAGTPVPRRMMARILNDALLGLHAAHELKDPSGKSLNLVHRDFSPQNILVSVQGHTRLGDFGVAKAADRAVRTKTGLTKGKIAYMSPEQARGHAVDRRCDVWAAGVVAWELLARRRIHKSDDDVATLLSIVTEHPPRLSTVLDDIPKAIDDALFSALQPDLKKRRETAESLRAALEAGWADAEGMADVSELSEFVRQVVDPELEERRSRIVQVQSLRERMGELTAARALAGVAPANDGTQQSGARIGSGVTQLTTRDGPARPEHTLRLESAPTTLAQPSVSDPDSGPLVSSGRGPANDLAPDIDGDPTRILHSSRPREELTETSAVVPTPVEPNRRTRQAVLAAGIVFGLGLATAWMWTATRESPMVLDSPAGEPAEAAAASLSTRTISDSPSDLPVEQQAGPNDSEQGANQPATVTVESLPLDTKPEARPSRPQARPHRPPPRPHKGPTPPAPTHKRVPAAKPKLADSPYPLGGSGE
jgi:serine/threonine-protein kinase